MYFETYVLSQNVIIKNSLSCNLTFNSLRFTFNMKQNDITYCHFLFLCHQNFVAGKTVVVFCKVCIYILSYFILNLFFSSPLPCFGLLGSNLKEQDALHSYTSSHNIQNYTFLFKIYDNTK